jgi:peptidoglycan/LPS O-acetylase OafA/YrhL
MARAAIWLYDRAVGVAVCLCLAAIVAGSASVPGRLACLAAVGALVAIYCWMPEDH